MATAKEYQSIINELSALHFSYQAKTAAENSLEEASKEEPFIYNSKPYKETIDEEKEKINFIKKTAIYEQVTRDMYAKHLSNIAGLSLFFFAILLLIISIVFYGAKIPAAGTAFLSASIGLGVFAIFGVLFLFKKLYFKDEYIKTKVSPFKLVPYAEKNFYLYQDEFNKYLNALIRDNNYQKKRYEEELSSYNKKKEYFLTVRNNIELQVKNAQTNYKIALENVKVVPQYYARDPEAVEKMLFFMMNKRADTVKELVNVYENTIWQEAMLESMNQLLNVNYDNKQLLSFVEDRLDAQYKTTIKSSLAIIDAIDDVRSSIPVGFVAMS